MDISTARQKLKSLGHFELNTVVQSKGPKDPTNPKSGLEFQVQAKVTVFKFREGEKQDSFVQKISCGLATGATVQEAEDAAIVRAVLNMGE